MCYLEDLINEVKDNKELVVEAEKDIIKLYRKGRIGSHPACLRDASLRFRTYRLGNLRHA